jgi:glycosyltransferase involved in cell wall biosynthesis
MRPVIVIPAYQPGPQFVPLVTALLDTADQHVIVVDDGSPSAYRPLFDQVGLLRRVHTLRHAINLGKGQALKTAFNYFLVTFGDECPGVVTADADGQHLLEDIGRVRAALETAPSALSLGTRRLRVNAPWKSAVGNRLTRAAFRAVIGRAIEDTQTGLRGIPAEFLKKLLRIPASGYDFELEMLVAAVRDGMALKQVSIATVYEDNNRSTHFDPIRDSLKVSFVFVRFVVLSLTTAALDLAVFALAYSATSNILGSTMVARVFAGAYNFSMARLVVFKSRMAAAPELLRFVALILWHMCVSYAVVTGLVIFAGVGVYMAKLIAETTLFVTNFAVQRLLVFRTAIDD